MKELIAGLALVGLASASKTRGGGALAGSDGFHAKKGEEALKNAIEFLGAANRSRSCSLGLKRAVEAYGYASEAIAHYRSLTGTGEVNDFMLGWGKDHAFDVRRESLLLINNNSCIERVYPIEYDDFHRS